ncbi:hypothetical protein KP509_1Z288400 [Ceratopteris richardii]|nr:hypothetical protein KP509_1Z288400 [Ceratopteris richardii]
MVPSNLDAGNFLFVSTFHFSKNLRTNKKPKEVFKELDITSTRAKVED